MPDAPASKVVLPRRTLAEQLAEELRRLDPDEIYLQALRGVDRIAHEAHSLPGIDIKRRVKKAPSAEKTVANTVAAKKAPAKKGVAKRAAGEPLSREDRAKPTTQRVINPAKIKSAAKKAPAKKSATKPVRKAK
jgi:hypothetical protein